MKHCSVNFENHLPWGTVSLRQTIRTLPQDTSLRGRVRRVELFERQHTEVKDNTVPAHLAPKK
jgi:hypothetical protein